jgi:hypothetical protein
MLTKAQYLEKHQTKYDKQGLSRSERSARYRQYQLSFANKERGVVGRSKQAKTPFTNGKLNTSYANFSQCTKDYALALIDPWSCPRAPCVPDNITLPSFKFAVRTRGQFQIGLLGTGFVYVNPYIPYGGFSSGFATANSYNSANVFPGVVTGSAPFGTDSTLTRLQFSSGQNQSRLVGSGLRIRYTGTELTRSGQAVTFRSSTNSNLFETTPMALTDFLDNRECTTAIVDRDWHYAIFRPAVATDLAYGNPVGEETNYALFVGVFGATAAQSFEFDFVAWFEIVGAHLPTLTRSHSDPIGIAAVNMALPIVQPSRSPTATSRSFLAEMANGVSNAMSFMPRMPGTPGMIQDGVSIAAGLGSLLL